MYMYIYIYSIKNLQVRILSIYNIYLDIPKSWNTEYFIGYMIKHTCPKHFLRRSTCIHRDYRPMKYVIYHHIPIGQDPKHIS